MRIGSVTDEAGNSPWEVYENYKKMSAENQDKTGALSNISNNTGECNTCDNRKYKDGSDDPGVSYKTPTRLDPSQAASAVRGHEMEHVVHNQAKAQREDRKVVSQSVTYHNAICPECGSVYISGGTTKTVTKGASQVSAENYNTSDTMEKSGFDRYA